MALLASLYQHDLDPVTLEPYKANPVFPTDYQTGNPGGNFDPSPYPGFDPHATGDQQWRGLRQEFGRQRTSQRTAFHHVVVGRLHDAGFGGLGGDAAQRFLLAIAKLGARVQ